MTNNNKKCTNISIDELKTRLTCIDILKIFEIAYDKNNISCPLPGHNDGTPSFNLFDNNAAFKCFGCGKGGDCIKLYELISQKSFKESLADLAKLAGIGQDTGTRTIVAIYDYRNADGSPCFQVVRFNPKGFSQRKNESDWSLKDVKRVLYKSPEVLDAKSKEIEIFLCEGEKDVETLMQHGFTATCNSGGAISGVKDRKWQDNYTDALSGAHLVIIPDKDEPGRKHAEAVADIMSGKALSIKIVELPDKDGKKVKDATDFFDAGGTAEELKGLVAKTAEYKIKVIPASNIVVVSPIDPETTNLRVEFANILMNRNLSMTEKYVRMAAVVCKYLLRRGRLFYHNKYKTWETAMYFDCKRHLLLKISSDEFLSWLSEYTGINRAEPVFEYIKKAIGTEALSGETVGIIPERYWAKRPDAIYISNGIGKMVKITANSYILVDNGTDNVLFESEFTLDSWDIVEPRDPFTECSLFSNANFESEHGLDLFRIWTLGIPTSPRCKPPIVMTGEVGSGKTRTILGLFELYGIKKMITKLDEKKEDDYWTVTNNGGIGCFDNVDTHTKWLADALSSAATGVGNNKRQLYSNDVIVHMEANSWVAITSANPMFASDAGLADRLLVVRMLRRKADTADSVLTDEIMQKRDSGLSFICAAISKALADKGNVPGNLNRRHPDFADFAVRLGRAIGRENETIAALRHAEAYKAVFNLENDDVGAEIINLMRNKGGFSGTIVYLLKEMQEQNSEFDMMYWTPKRVGKRISKLWAHISDLYDATEDKSGSIRTIRLKKRNNGMPDAMPAPTSEKPERDVVEGGIL